MQGDPALAPGIRAVAALHKNAEGVMNMIDTWQQGRTPFGRHGMDGEHGERGDHFGWRLFVESRGGGDLEVRGSEKRLDEFAALGQTPDDFKALGWIYVPGRNAPADLRSCLDAGGMIAVARNFLESNLDLALNLDLC